jgi:hypothetical protein
MTCYLDIGMALHLLYVKNDKFSGYSFENSFSIWKWLHRFQEDLWRCETRICDSGIPEGYHVVIVLSSLSPPKLWLTARICTSVLEDKSKHKIVLVLNKAPLPEDVWESGGIAPCIRYIETGCRRVVSFILRPSYPRVKNPYIHRIGCWMGPQSLSGCCGGEKKSLPLPQIESRSLTRSLVTVLTELPRILSVITFVSLRRLPVLSHWFHIENIGIKSVNTALCIQNDGSHTLPRIYRFKSHITWCFMYS